MIRAAAKFFYRDGEKLWVRGVTYGTFEPDEGTDYPTPERVAEDFGLMKAAGINTVRIYTVPPRYLLDEAQRQGLAVIVGLAWTQHVCFLDDRRIASGIVEQVQKDVRSVAGHPAIMAFAIGNEIPAQIVRWHGGSRIERFLRRLYDTVKKESPEALVTYVNYPPTDYLDLSFLDFVCFNVFLHERADFKAYVAKLQNIACNRPLVLTELGLDSLRHGVDGQAEFLDWQLAEAFGAGAAGVCVFSWTDDWYRGGHQIDDWAFGLVDAERRPKPAYDAVKARLGGLPFPREAQQAWPKVSVVICAYNAQSTIKDNLDSLTRLRYPNYEVVVVDDGSTDETARIAARYPFKLISGPNVGLSAARNIGYRAASGEIIAYTDSDTRVDEDWLSYLIQPFVNSDVVGVGGPNVVPSDDGWVAQCVARSPGGPTQVLLNDTLAEHIPGCNMAFRKSALETVGGFDPTYTKAGDDVDICWRLQEQGWHLAFSHSALVWHHHRNSVKAYWKQQVGYGEGESFLEHRHQEKFNERGQTRWQGRIYSALPAYRSLFKSVIYHGRWGASAFPSVYQGGIVDWRCLPMMIEWQAATIVSLFFAFFSPAFLLLPLLLVAATLWRCVVNANSTKLDDLPATGTNGDRRLSEAGFSDHFKYRMMIAWLHYLQPWARLRGRIKGHFGETNVPGDGLRPSGGLSFRDTARLMFSRLDTSFWDVHYVMLDDFLGSLKEVYEVAMRPVRSDDGWQNGYDLQLRAGHAYSIKVKVTAEDHGGTRRLFRVRFKMITPWRLFLLALPVIVGVGFGIYQVSGLWELPISSFVVLLAVLFRGVSARGGEAVLATEEAAVNLKLYPCKPGTSKESGDVAPALESQTYEAGS